MLENTEGAIKNGQFQIKRGHSELGIGWYKEQTDYIDMYPISL